MTTLVLDTNLLVRALLFRGVPSRILALVHARQARLAVSAAIIDEYLRVLAYRKFGLSPDEVRAAMETQVLPFCQLVVALSHFAIGPVCRDADDDKFLACARACNADALLTGDADLLALGPIWQYVPIVTAAHWFTSNEQQLASMTKE